MMEKKDTMAAFPNGTWQTGMSLRDWLAGQALAGMMPTDGGGFRDWSWYAEASYHLADAMLAARAIP